MDLVAYAPRFPRKGESVVGTKFLTYPGGKGANQAVAVARLGAQVRMIGRVGADAFGQQLLDSLAADGVDVTDVAVDSAASSGIAAITIDASSQNRIVQVPGANASCGPREVERAIRALEGASVLMLQLEVPVEVSLAVAREAASRGVTVVLDPAPARPLPEELYRHCAFITPNETEAQALVGFAVDDPASARRAASELAVRGAGCAVIKMGAGGAYYASQDQGCHLPAFHVEAVDSVAAGDAFNGALAVAIAESVPLDEAIRWGMAAGALAVTRTGGQDSRPRREQVEGLLAGR